MNLFNEILSTSSHMQTSQKISLHDQDKAQPSKAQKRKRTAIDKIPEKLLKYRIRDKLHMFLKELRSSNRCSFEQISNHEILQLFGISLRPELGQSQECLLKIKTLILEQLDLLRSEHIALSINKQEIPQILFDTWEFSQGILPKFE